MKEMRQFKRGIDKTGVSAAKEFFETRVGKEIKKNQQLQICIRDNYINVYWNGCSILKYSPIASEGNKYEIHKKYIDSDSIVNKNEKLELKDGDLVWNNQESYIEKVLKNPPHKPLMDYLEANDEKCYIAEYLKKKIPKPFLLDLEVAYTRKNENGKSVADRVDMAIISENLQLQLIEVKPDWNNALKSKERGKQKIIDQMERYKEFIAKEKPNIEASYKVVAQNYVDLKLYDRLPKLGVMSQEEVLEKFIKEGRVDPIPRLLVIKTGKSMEGRYGNHWEHLKEPFKDKYELLSWEASE